MFLIGCVGKGNACCGRRVVDVFVKVCQQRLIILRGHVRDDRVGSMQQYGGSERRRRTSAVSTGTQTRPRASIRVHNKDWFRVAAVAMIYLNASYRPQK